jgi:hypothetical protein
VMNAEPAKVRCRTCHSDHDYRHEQAPPPKVDPRKAALFQEVLKKVDPDGAAPAEIVDDVELPVEGDEAVGEEAVVEEAVAVEEEAPAPVAKAKAKGRGKK